MFEIYKPNQGTRVRWSTFLVGAAIGLAGAWWLSEQLSFLQSGWGVYLRYGLPVLLLGGVALLMFWLVNRPSSADFMIGTEGEMKKVAWSSRREIVGSTKVVIFATFAMALLLFMVDILFRALFDAIDVLRIG